MADTNSLRERRKEASDDSPLTKTTTNVTPSPAAAKRAKKSPNELASQEDSAPFSLVDILRSLVFLVIASCGLSYVITKDSYIWGLKRPNWSQVEVIKAYWVCHSSPLLLLPWGFGKVEQEARDDEKRRLIGS